MTKILAPIDMTDKGLAAKVIDSAVSQAKASDASLTVLTVVPDMVTGVDFRYAIRGETGGSEEYDMSKILAETLSHLNKMVEELTPSGMTADTIARHGSVAEQVLKVADEIEADQIVMGAHQPGLEDFLLGSNTARVVRHAKCSVNVIRG